MAYGGALKVVEKITGITMEPHRTLREYLNATVPDLSGAAGAFTELTGMAEIVLYSNRDIASDLVEKAEGCAAAIKEELGK